MRKKENIIFRERKVRKHIGLRFRVFGWATTLTILFMTQGVSVANSAPVITEFSINPAIIRYDESSTLRWSSVNATSATITGIGTVDVNGSAPVSPGVTTTYTITVTGPGGTAIAGTNLIVTGAYLTAVPGYEIDLGSVKPGNPGNIVTFTRGLLIGRSNMGTVTVSLEGTNLEREEINAEGKGIGSYDALPTTYNWDVSYDRESNDINMNLDITVETKGPGDEGSSDAGVYWGSFTVTLSGSL